MSEPEKKGSPWPWILVPIAAFGLFFVLRQCRQSIPPANHAPAPAVSAPSTTDVPASEPSPAEPDTAPASAPAPQ
ncbi:MAG: hypothetical protein WDO72_09855 [Pseudomonadota bacterium]